MYWKRINRLWAATRNSVPLISVSPQRRISVWVHLALLVMLSAMLLSCGGQEEKTEWREPTRIGLVLPGNSPLQEAGEMLRLGVLVH